MKFIIFVILIPVTLGAFLIKRDDINYLVPIAIAQISNLGYVLLPSFYLYGLRRLKELMLNHMFIKLIAIGFTFLLIRNIDDVNLAIWIYSLSIVLVGLISFLKMSNELSVSIADFKPDFKNIKNIWNNISSIFYSGIVKGLINQIAILGLLGILASGLELGYFSVGAMR